MGYEMHQKDSYHFVLVIGGHQNKYNRPDHEKPSSPQGGTGRNNNNHNHHHHHHHHHDSDDKDDDHHPEQNHHSPQQGVLQLAPPPPSGPYAGTGYSTPYPYPYPPPPYQNQLAVGGDHGGDYHHDATGYPGSSYVPHQQGGSGNHGGGGGRMNNDVGLVGAAIGVVSFGLFKFLRERRRYGRRRH